MSLSKTRLLTLTVVAAVVALGLTGVVPVWSQTQRITALEVSVSVPVDDPWNSLWDRVEPATVVLSPQNMVAPFGGGSVPLLDVRALHDAGRLYLLLEWEDSSIEDDVGRVTDFSDAAALQFPVTDADTPFTMGGPGVPVNIWHWKAVWQADIVAGFSGVQDEYPHTYVDMYPGEGDSLYRPAEALGNALAQRTHSTPIENLVAEGFGSLTTAEIQDVDGWGEWRDGRWRALFVRDLAASAEGFADFDGKSEALVAFAVWDGGAGDRDGQKSYAPFVTLDLTGEPVAAEPVAPSGRVGAGVWAALAIVVVVTAFIVRMATLGRREPPTEGP